jgi:hypothetical protein
MELDEIKAIWTQHEKILVDNTRINKELLKKLLMKNAEKRIDWLKIKSLAGLVLALLGIIFVAIPRIQFTLEPASVIGIVLFVSLAGITYGWAIKLYLLIERLSPDAPVTTVRKQLNLVEKQKLKIKKYGLILAPFMIVGIFLSAGIPFLSVKMIPFYILSVIVFLISTYIRSKHGLVVQIRKIDKEMEEISNLELDKVL